MERRVIIHKARYLCGCSKESLVKWHLAECRCDMKYPAPITRVETFEATREVYHDVISYPELGIWRL